MPTLESIGQIAISTHDLPRAVAFYRDDLGLEYLFDAGPLAFLGWDVRIMLAVESDELDHRARPLLPRERHPRRAGRARGSRCPVRRRTAPHRADARPRALDDLLPRPRPQPARPHERGPARRLARLGQHHRELEPAVERHRHARERRIGLAGGRIGGERRRGRARCPRPRSRPARAAVWPGRRGSRSRPSPRRGRRGRRRPGPRAGSHGRRPRRAPPTPRALPRRRSSARRRSAPGSPRARRPALQHARPRRSQIAE